MAYFDELLQRAITVRNNRAPASNMADLVGGVLVGIVTALQMLLDDKQDELTFDNAPTADSQNPVTSDGIYQALQAIDLSACEKIVNKVTSINAQSTDVQYPTAKLLYDSLQALSGIYAAIVHTHAIADIINLQTELDARQLVSNLVTAITAQATDTQYPSAKAVYDCCIAVQAALQSLDERVSRLELFHSFRIKGTSTNIGQTISIVVRTLLDSNNKTISINVDSEGNWQYEYFGKMVVLQLTDSTIVTVDMTEADDFNAMTSLPIFSQSVEEIDMSNALFDNIVKAGERYSPWLTGSSLRKIDMRNASFANMTSAYCMFYNCSALEEIRLDNATFANLTSTGYLAQQNDNTQMFRCQNLTTLVLSKATFAKVETAVMMFAFCYKLPSIDMPEATFERLQNAAGMFLQCKLATHINAPKITFGSLTNAMSMFDDCNELLAISFAPNVDYSQLIATGGNIRYYNWPQRGMFANCKKLTTIDLSSATFEYVTDSRGVFAGCNALTTLVVPQNSTAIDSTATETNTPLDFRNSPLTYASMLAVANWLRDFTGGTAHTCTFKTSAWNALTAAEQSNIDTILSGKNWTRVLG